MSAHSYEGEQLAEIQLLGELVDLAGNTAGKLTTQDLDEVLGPRGASSSDPGIRTRGSVE